MGRLVESVQAALPLALFAHLEQLRTRYAKALEAAAKGDYSCETELRTVARFLGYLLAREARKQPEERGGLPMLEISLAVDRMLPEMRGWTQHETQRGHQRRLARMASVGDRLPVPPSGRRRVS